MRFLISVNGVDEVVEALSAEEAATEWFKAHAGSFPPGVAASATPETLRGAIEVTPLLRPRKFTSAGEEPLPDAPKPLKGLYTPVHNTMLTQLRESQRDLSSLLRQIERRGGADGHLFIGADCVICGHYGPDGDIQLCEAEQRFAELRSLWEEADGLVKLYALGRISTLEGRIYSLCDALSDICSGPGIPKREAILHGLDLLAQFAKDPLHNPGSAPSPQPTPRPIPTGVPPGGRRPYAPPAIRELVKPKTNVFDQFHVRHMELFNSVDKTHGTLFRKEEAYRLQRRELAKAMAEAYLKGDAALPDVHERYTLFTVWQAMGDVTRERP